MKENHQGRIKKQVKYIVLGEDNQHRKQFIDAINCQDRESNIAVYSAIERCATLKDREDFYVRAIMTDIPVAELDRIRQYRGNCQGVIILLTLEQINLLQAFPQNFTMSRQLVRAYCELFQQQLDSSAVKSSRLRQVKRQKLPKLLISSYFELNVQRPRELLTQVYQAIKESNERVWKFIEENNTRYFIYDKTYDWVVNPKEQESNIQLIRSQLQANNYNIRQSVRQDLSDIYEQSRLIVKQPRSSERSYKSQVFSERSWPKKSFRQKLSTSPNQNEQETQIINNNKEQIIITPNKDTPEPSSSPAKKSPAQEQRVAESKKCTCCIQ